MTARVDVNVPRFNQAMVAGLIGVAFVAQWWPLVAVTAAILAATRFGGPAWGLFTQTYLRWIRPRLQGTTITEEAAPPRFAQLIGFLFLLLASVLLGLGWAVAGWTIALLVFALALLAATTRICVGCLIYELATG
ncbi:MAG: DUF4395 domain-containing protein [Acidimicrobiia bacterium]